MRYRNQTEQELVITGIGVVSPGGEIETDEVLENPNLELVGGTAAQEPVTQPTNDQEGSV